MCRNQQNPLFLRLLRISTSARPAGLRDAMAIADRWMIGSSARSLAGFERCRNRFAARKRVKTTDWRRAPLVTPAAEINAQAAFSRMFPVLTEQGLPIECPAVPPWKGGTFIFRLLSIPGLRHSAAVVSVEPAVLPRAHCHDPDRQDLERRVPSASGIRPCQYRLRAR
jgi:hypothetical protein